MLILLLNSTTPYSFLSGAKLGREIQAINVLANICFLTRADNNKIKARGPSDYLKDIEATKKEEYLKNALCPLDFSNMAYDTFLEERSKQLTSRAEELMG